MPLPRLGQTLTPTRELISYPISLNFCGLQPQNSARIPNIPFIDLDCILSRLLKAPFVCSLRTPLRLASHHVVTHERGIPAQA